LERPRTLEELIPVEVRKRWGITTSTPIALPGPPSLERLESEIPAFNTIAIRYYVKESPGKMGIDKTIRKYMRGVRLPTKRTLNENRLKLREWAVRNGQKIVFEVIKE
jgi:hypothetical protein